MARAAVIVELAAIAAVAIVPVPVPAAWLLAVASASMWARGKSWSPSPLAPGSARPPAPELVPIGVVCGAIALVAALVISAPLADVTGRAVEWSQYAIVRGSPQNFVVIA